MYGCLTVCIIIGKIIGDYILWKKAGQIELLCSISDFIVSMLTSSFVSTWYAINKLMLHEIYTLLTCFPSSVKAKYLFSSEMQHVCKLHHGYDSFYLTSASKRAQSVAE